VYVSRAFLVAWAASFVRKVRHVPVPSPGTAPGFLRDCGGRGCAQKLLEGARWTRALECSQQSLELYPDDLSVLVCAACLRARLGQKEEALELIERVFARGWGKRDWVEHDPDYDILRDDPRFKKLLARLK